jgi:ribosomal protein L22
MSADETNKDDVTPDETPEAAEIEAKASQEAAESQPAPKKPRSRKKAEASEEAAEPKAVEAEASEEAAETKPKRPRQRKAPAPAAEKPAAEKPARREREAAKPARRGGSRRTAEPAVLVRAQAKYVRTSARKARLVCDTIRGKDVAEARAILAFTPRHAAKAWSKLLESAIANAENNHELVGEDLRIHSVVADEGPTLKRFRPRAMGRATRIRKRTSHLTITLTPKES